jgi:hypothetical protein
MADAKLSALTQETVLFGTDILYFAKDTGGGTFASRGILIGSFIDDAGTGSFKVWSSTKISTELSAVSAGIKIKNDVQTATGPGDGNITLSGEQTINGVLTSGSRVLLTDQTDPTENGIYDTAAGAWTRAADYDGNPGSEVENGDTIYVNNVASTKHNFKYLNTTQDPITVGVTPLTYTEHLFHEFCTTAGTACEGNDSRLPTQDENDALQGTNGVPSNANRYVTDSDPRLADDGDNNTLAINQVAHALTAGEVVYDNAGTWTKAQANDKDTLGIAIVTVVTDVDNFTYVTLGNATVTAHGYTEGQYLFLSAATPGLLTEIEPTGLTEFSNPVAYVVDANTLLILPWRPIQAIPRYNDIRIVSTPSLNYNVDDIDEMVLADATAGAQDINLPTPSAAYDGFEITIKKVDGTVNDTTIKSPAGNIDGTLGTTGIVLSTQYVSYTLVCDGANWWIK